MKGKYNWLIMSSIFIIGMLLSLIVSIPQAKAWADYTSQTKTYSLNTNGIDVLGVLDFFGVKGNLLGQQSLVDITLDYNTDKCFLDSCYNDKTYHFNSDFTVSDKSVLFYSLNRDEIDRPSSDYLIQNVVEIVNDYGVCSKIENKCYENINNITHQPQEICEDKQVSYECVIGNHTEIVEKEIPFNWVGYEAHAGDEIKIRSRTVIQNEKVEWVENYMGFSLDAWAWYDGSKLNKYSINCSNIQAGQPFEVNGSNGFTINGQKQIVWTVCSGTGNAIYFNDFNDYVIANDTAELPFRVESGNVSSYIPNGVNISTYRWRVENNANDENGVINLVAQENATFNATDLKEGSYSWIGRNKNGEEMYHATFLDTARTTYTNGFTISAWMRPHVTATSMEAMGKFNGWSGLVDGFLFGVDNANHFKIQEARQDSWANVFATNFTYTVDTWYYVTAVLKSNGNVLLYVNGTLINQDLTSIASLFFDGTEFDFAEGAVYRPEGTLNKFNGGLDDLRFYNSALTSAYIDADYNNYMGTAGYGTLGALEINTDIKTTLISPINSFSSSSPNINFSCNSTPIGVILKNVSLYIYNPNNSIYYNNKQDLSGASSVVTQWNLTNITDNTYKWNCLSWDTTGGYSSWGTNRTLTIDANIPYVRIDYPSATVFNSFIQPYNASLNNTITDSHLDTCYFNTSESSTKNIFSGNKTTFNISKQGSGAVYVYCNDTFGNTNSTSANYTIHFEKLGFCNATYNKPAFNITFWDETYNNASNSTIDSLVIDYTYDGVFHQTLSYVNTVANASDYGFCLWPNSTANLSLSYNISYTGFNSPQRRANSLTASLFNTSVVEKKLYTLPTADGIYSSFSVVSTGNQVIEGAQITIERQVGGVWTVIGYEITDSAGVATFWVNPNYDIRYTVVATGYASQTGTIRPTQSIYTVTMGSSSSGFTSTSWMDGINYVIYPPSGLLAPNKYYNFTCHISARQATLEDCRFDLMDSKGIVYANASGCSASEGTLSIYTLYTKNTFGRVLIKVNGTWYVVESDAHWANLSLNVSGNVFGGVLAAINQSINMPEWGANPDGTPSQTADFSRIVFFFLVFGIVLAAINFYTGYDTAYPGAVMYIVFAAITIMTFVNGPLGPGYFYMQGMAKENGTLAGEILNNCIVFMFATIMMLSNMLSTMRRNQ